jgi:hypothetical protein
MPTLPTPDELYAYLERGARRLTTTEPDDLGPIGSRGRALAWNWSFWGRAMVFAYRATSEDRFLELFVTTLSGILEQRDDRLGLIDAAKGRVVAGWGTDLGGAHLNEVTVAGLSTLPICEFLLLLRDDSRVSERYGDTAAEYLAVVEDVVWQFEDDYRLTPFGGQYLNAATRSPEPLNHTHALAATFAHLAALTPAHRYREKVIEIGQFFRSSVTEEPNGSWSWPYVAAPGSGASRPAEPIWKAGTTLEFPVAAIRHGLAFADAIEPLTRTLLHNVLRPDGINRSITSLDTSLLDEQYVGKSLAGAGFALWFLMPDDANRIRSALIAQMDNQPEFFPRAWLGGARGLSMAAAWLMGRQTWSGRSSRATSGGASAGSVPPGGQGLDAAPARQVHRWPLVASLDVGGVVGPPAHGVRDRRVDARECVPGAARPDIRPDILANLGRAALRFGHRLRLPPRGPRAAIDLVTSRGPRVSTR